MLHTSSLTYILFAIAVVLTALILFYSIRFRRVFVMVILLWILVQSAFGLSGFYTVASGKPPKLLFMILPPMLFLITSLLLPKGRKFMDSFDIKSLTLLHIVRIPVEIVLYLLFISKAVPVLMTFEGRNVDILSGLSAPFIYYFGFVKKSISKKWILVWNIICLLLLINVVFYALLSAPTPFQQFAFDQPNIAIAHFPFNLLPAFIVPMVVLSHVISIRQLSMKS